MVSKRISRVASLRLATLASASSHVRPYRIYRKEFTLPNVNFSKNNGGDCGDMCFTTIRHSSVSVLCVPGRNLRDHGKSLRRKSGFHPFALRCFSPVHRTDTASSVGGQDIQES